MRRDIPIEMGVFRVDVEGQNGPLFGKEFHVLYTVVFDRVGIDGESALKISSAVGCVRCVIRYSIMARRCKEGFTPKPDRY